MTGSEGSIYEQMKVVIIRMAKVAENNIVRTKFAIWDWCSAGSLCRKCKSIGPPQYNCIFELAKGTEKMYSLFDMFSLLPIALFLLYILNWIILLLLSSKIYPLIQPSFEFMALTQNLNKFD